MAHHQQSTLVRSYKMHTEYENLNGDKMIKVEHEDGSCTCYTLEQWADFQVSRAALSTPIVSSDAD